MAMRRIPMPSTDVSTREETPVRPNPPPLPKIANGYDSRVTIIPSPPPLPVLRQSPIIVPHVASRMPVHMAMRARAGTGKTFSLVEGFRRRLGKKTEGIVGSEQQEAIWQEMMQGPRPGKVVVCAFNKSIKNEIETDIKMAGLKESIDVFTAHGFGYKQLAMNKKIHSSKGLVQKYKTSMILEKLIGVDIRDMMKEWPGFVQGIGRVVSMCKANLMGVGWGDYPEATEEVVDWVIGHYGISIEATYMESVYGYVPRILEEGLTDLSIIDFDDMVMLPVALHCDVRPYDWACVDEAQDLTVAARTLVQSVGLRMAIVGDEAQAIYAFAGADSESMPSFISKLEHHPRGCMTFPLTKTRRCGHAIVRLAQQLVPDIEALETNPEGRVVYSEEADYLYDLLDGHEEFAVGKTLQNMVICRSNAPLVTGVMRMIKHKKKAWIEGGETAKDLKELIEQLKPDSAADLCGKVDDWFQREWEKLSSRKWCSEDALDAVTEKRECLFALTEGVTTTREVLKNLETIFADTTEEGARREGVRFSTIHKSKGLEARTVHFLQHDKVPSSRAKTPHAYQQELNLRYVGLTRACDELRLIESTKKKPS